MLWQFLSRMMVLQADSALRELVEQLLDEVAVRLPRWRSSVATSKRFSVKPEVEVLSARIVPAINPVNLYWDPTQGGNLANSVLNWDVGSLGSGINPGQAPGNKNGETDNIYFDGSTLRSNTGCTWNYKPTNTLGSAAFVNGWNQQLAFSDQAGFSVSNTSYTADTASPTLAPNGSSGSNAMAAITLTNGCQFNTSSKSKLLLSGWSTGNAVFFAGDGKAGEYFYNAGTVVYTGAIGGDNAFVDYLKIPVLNAWTNGFKVNGSGTGGAASLGGILQISGSDKNTSGVSFFQNNAGAETDISGNGTLWCVNNFTMNAGLLQTMDSYTDKLMVGTGPTQPVDGTVNLLGGTVNINPNKVGKPYGILEIMGTTGANNPIVNIGGVTLNFKVSMTTGSNASDQLIVGSVNGSGTPNFGYQGATTTVAILPQGNTTTGHNWQVILFGQDKKTGDVTLSPATGFTKNWQPKYLEIDN